MNEERHMIWLRLGCAFYVTPEEAKILFESDPDSGEGEQLLRRLIREGHWDADGDTYIPDDSIMEYNREYETSFPEQEAVFCM